jgi:hypothetical protein
MTIENALRVTVLQKDDRQVTIHWESRKWRTFKVSYYRYNVPEYPIVDTYQNATAAMVRYEFLVRSFVDQEGFEVIKDILHADSDFTLESIE